MAYEPQFSALLIEAVTRPGIMSDAYRAFHRYSIGNQLAAAFQCAVRPLPLGPIATFRGWQEKGRSVRKGEKAISLCMPVTCKGEQTDPDTGEIEAVAYSRFLWRNHWFVLSQTDGDDYAHEVPTPTWDKTHALTALDVSERPFDLPDGNCQGYAVRRSIAVSPLARFPHKTRFHELAHVILGHTSEHDMQDDELTPRNIEEVEAESVAFILCHILDLPGKDESRGYIQSWLHGDSISEKSAQKIFSAADKILKAGQACAQ